MAIPTPGATVQMESSVYDRTVRWPAVMQQVLGNEYNIIEEGHCGRTTVFDDPEVPGRNGSRVLNSILTTHAPLDMIIIMLGTNDLKDCYQASISAITEGLAKLTEIIITHESFQSKHPLILIIAPPPLAETADNEIKESFRGAKEKSHSLGREIVEFFNDTPVFTVNTDKHIQSSNRDGIHLEAEDQIKLGKLIAEEVKLIFFDIFGS